LNSGEIESLLPPHNEMPAGGVCATASAYCGSVGVDAVVTALVLAASRPSVSAPSIGRTDPSATRNVRVCGEEGVTRVRRPDTCSAVVAVIRPIGCGASQIVPLRQ
jgi:hypothetical protein